MNAISESPPTFEVLERIAPVRFDSIETPARLGPDVTVESGDEGYVVRVSTLQRDRTAALECARATVDRLLCLMSLRGAVLSRVRRALPADVRSVGRTTSGGGSRCAKATIALRVVAHGGVRFIAKETDSAMLRVSLGSRLQRALSLFHLGCCALERETGFLTHHTALEVLSGENKKRVLRELLLQPQRRALLEEVCAIFERYRIPGGVVGRLRRHLEDTKLESDLDLQTRYLSQQRAMQGTPEEIRKALREIRNIRGGIVHSGDASDLGSFTKHRLMLERVTRKALLSEIEHAIAAEPVGAEASG